MMRKTLPGLAAVAAMMTLAGCNDAPTARARAQVQAAQPNSTYDLVETERDRHIIGPEGQEIPCTAYGGANCPSN